MVDAVASSNAAAAGVTERATFAEADLFETDFSKAQVITMFLLPVDQHEAAADHPEHEARHARRVELVHDGGLAGGPASRRSRDCTSWCTAHLWIVPAKVEGTWQLPQGALTLKQSFQNVSGSLGTHADHRRQAARRGDHVHGRQHRLHRPGEGHHDERHGQRRRQVERDEAVAG